MKRDVHVQRTSNGWVQVVAGGSVRDSWRGYTARARGVEAESRLRIAAAVLDDHLPLRGPCGCCGCPGVDQTHRIEDAIAGMARAYQRDEPDMDDLEWIAEEFNLPTDAGIVEACLIWSPP